MKMKDTFILRTEWYSALETLTEKGKSQILDALFLLHLGRETEINIKDPSAKLCWSFMEPSINYYSKKYNASVENGKKGGRPITQEKPKITQDNLKVIEGKTLRLESEKPKPNLTVYVSDNVSVSEGVSGCEDVFECEGVLEVVNGKKLDYTDKEAQKLLEPYLK